MKRRTILSFAIVATSIAAVALSTILVSSKQIANLKAKADPAIYSLTLNSSNASSSLTTSYQRSVTTTVQTTYGNEMTLNLTNAKSFDGGYAKLGNYGTIYCVTNDAKHISGLSSVRVTYSGGSLKLKSSGVQSADGASYVTTNASLVSGTTYDLPNPANSFVLEAGEGEVSIEEIKLNYSCQTANESFNFSKVYDVEDFESYTATGNGYDTSHNMGSVTNLRSQFYSVYYGAGSNPLGGSGWQIMGSSDYLNYHATAGRNGSKTALFKSNSGNYFEYIQAKHFFGVPTAIGKGARLSAWIHGAYADTSGTPGAAAEVTLIAYYNNVLNTSDTNVAATATYTINGSDGWGEYIVDLDPAKTVYAFGIHIKKASATLYLPVDDVKIYTESPYGNVAAASVSVNPNSTSLLIGDTKTLTATVLPANATNKAVLWSSNNSSIASVDQNGVVTANALGNAVITATTVDGGLTASCNVAVTQVYPGGTFFNIVTIQNRDISIEVMCTTRADVVIYFYGFKTEGARFTSYSANTGAFVIEIDGEVDLGLLGTYTYGTMTGTYVNDQMENVGLTGSIKNLLGSDINNKITLSHPSNYFWNCDGDNSTLQSVFKRRYRYNNTWSTDISNSDRLQADSTNKTSGTNGLKVRGYSAGIGLSLNNDLNNGNGILKDDHNTLAFWIFNPGTTDIKIQVYVFKGAGLDSNTAYQTMTTAKTIPSQTWTYVRIGYGNLADGTKIYNFNITNLPGASADPFIIDDIWFHG